MNHAHSELTSQPTADRFKGLPRWPLCIFAAASLCAASVVSSPCAALLMPVQAADDEQAPKLSSQLRGDVETALAGDVTRAIASDLYWNAIRESGDVEGLLKHLWAERNLIELLWSEGVKTPEQTTRFNAIRQLEAHIHWRRGDGGQTLTVLDALIEADSDDIDLRYWRARVYDLLGRIDETRAEYERVLETTEDTELQRKLHLRLALMGLLGGSQEQQQGLAEFALQQEDADTRNRAAIVLAVQDRPQDAIDLFVVGDTGTRRFRMESRVAEWAIRAKDAVKAKGSAWSAVKSAELRRDRRYALTLLVEAHRLDDSIDALINRFASEENLTDEERKVWIDLLREQERYDEAIDLFRQSSQGGSFTIDMRRELLEMERSAGREEQLIESYRTLIADEPDELTWRSGLTQLLLERGDQELAEELWPQYIASQTSGGRLLMCAQALAELGLDELAESTVNRMMDLGVDTGPGMLFLAAIHSDRGRLTEAEAVLDHLDELIGASDAVRFELAEAYERLGRQAKAVRIMEQIRAERETLAEDLEMRLAWLYSEIGEEEKGLDLWMQLWRRIDAVPRRRYAEDRLMSVASRLGKLADIAVDLEVKLTEGNADEREAGLLIAIYTRVNDPISATEVLSEFFRQTGGAPLKVLQEKARIFLTCTDYHNYEKTVREMIVVDPENELDYLRQLAMSQLERGRPDEARDVLSRLRTAQGDDVSREFEAGVLTLAGMRSEAMEAYRRGIAEHPDRIESYLLLANLMRDLGLVNRAIGMFQYLAETAEQDDMFTIAIDGILNMEPNRPTVEWARRITLERLAGRGDKNYLYQLLADLSEEANDKDGQIRALENSIAVAGTRRLSVLRECMDLSSNLRGGAFATVRPGQSNAGNEQFYAFARRLIGLQEAVPPQVFLDLGRAFLDDDDVINAWHTFGLARDLPDERAYRREVAGIFESAGHRPEALRVYERLLRTSPSNIGLMAKVAQLHEQEGRDAVASQFYRQGIDLLLMQAPLTTLEQSNDTEMDRMYMWGGNRDAFQTHFENLMRGLLVTMPEEAVDDLLTEFKTALDAELADLEREIDRGVEVTELASAPRIDKRVSALRRMLIAFGRLDEADQMDIDLLVRFSDQEDLLPSIAQTRIDWGYIGSVRKLAAQSGQSTEALDTIRVMLGETFDPNESGMVDPPEAMKRVVPMLIAGQRDAARALLRRVKLSNISGTGRGNTMVVMVNGLPTVTTDMSTPASEFMRIANRLEDDGLALRFARAWIENTINANAMTNEVMMVFEQTAELLAGDTLNDYLNFVVDLLDEKPERQANYIGVLASLGEKLGRSLIDEEKMLAGIDDGNVRLGWQLEAGQFIESMPEAIRATALERVLSNTPAGERTDPLFAAPFTTTATIDDNIARILSDYFAGDLRVAKENGRLEFITGRVTMGGEPLMNVENGDLALQMLEALQEHMPSKEMQAVIALRARVLRQMGRVDEAMAITLDLQSQPEPPQDSFYATRARSDLFRVMHSEYPQRFIEQIEERQAEQGATVELTDERLRIARNNQDLYRSEIQRAIETHPDEGKYTTMLEQLERRSGRTREAIAINNRILAKARESGEADEAGPTKEEVGEAILQAALDQFAGAGRPVDLIRQSYQDMFSQTSMEELLEMARQQGITIPGGGKMATVEINRRLAGLWDQLSNPIKSLEHWRAVVEAEAENAEPDQPVGPDGKPLPPNARGAVTQASGRTAVAGGAVAASTLTRAASAASSGRIVASTVRPVRIQAASGSGGTFTLRQGAAAPAPAAAQAAASSEDALADMPDNIETVHAAVQAERFDHARKVLRRVWRMFPIENDMGIIRFNMQGPFARLMWPQTPDEPAEADAANDGEQATDEPAEEKAERRAERRKQMRGGLVNIRVRERPQRREMTSAWEVLSQHEFGINEMKRLLRSRSAMEARSSKPVILGLLAADRKARGDDIVAAELLEDVREGQAGQVELIKLFAMLNDSPDLIQNVDRDLLDQLVRTIEPTETLLLARVAGFYADIDEFEPAERLYEFCASKSAGARDLMYYNPFAVNQSVNLSTLVAEIREHFDGDQLIDLLKRVFAAAPDAGESTSLLATETWIDLLGAQNAIAQLADTFANLSDPNMGVRRQTAKRGAEVYAMAGNLDEAKRCLREALRTVPLSELDDMMQRRFGLRGQPLRGSLSTEDLLRLFPEDMSAFADPTAWLAAATSVVQELVEQEQVDKSLASQPLAVIGWRMSQQGDQAAAQSLVESLIAMLDDSAGRHGWLLALDVARECGASSVAASLAETMNERQTLPAVRFGDYVRDVHATNGHDAATALVDDLLAYSCDKELIAAAIEIARSAETPDEQRIAGFEALASQAVEALDEVEALRKKLAANRQAARPGVRPARIR